MEQLRFYFSIILIILSFQFCIAQDYSDPDTRNYAKIHIDSLGNEVNNLIVNRLYDKALIANEKLLNETINVYGLNSMEASTVLFIKGSLYDMQENYTDALNNYLLYLHALQETNNTNSEDYATVVRNIARCYFFIGTYDKAKQFGQESLDLYKNLYGKTHPYYVTSLSNLALYNALLGNYQEAIRLGTMAMEIDQEVLGEKHPQYATLLNNLATYNYNIANYRESIS